ncbi:SCO1860 family LAETG-anchored protein [Streptacidiphilus sp. EB129]|uniref:SCO1860 family LAETG-anchored protein n=1 Tax=Streptacidiphilus sp. EB129 TaxID=3156262 RepID=UPI003518E9CE
MLAIRRPAPALGAAVAASLITAVCAAAPATAAPGGLPPAAAPAGAGAASVGTASATTARLGLDVQLLDSAIDVPLSVSLNAVRAPHSVDGSMLRAGVQGVQGGVPQTLLDATLGHSSATADAQGSHAEVDLVTAALTVPGLPGTKLLGLKEVTARADCPVSGQPTARANVLGDLTVLGKTVSLSAGGPTRVAIPGLGVVDVEWSAHSTTSTTAAATALELSVTVNPLNLNVAKVTGSVELAAVSCAEPAGGERSGPAPTRSGAAGAPVPGGAAPGVAPAAATVSAAVAPAVPGSVSASPQAPDTSLAQTGGGSGAPALAGAAAVLSAVGVGGLAVTRRRRRRH